MRLSVFFAVSSTLAMTTGSQVSGQEQPVDLGAIILRGDKVGRTTDDASPSTSVIGGETIEQSSNLDIDDVLSTQPNVLANEGFKPPAIRGVDGIGGNRPAISAGSQPRIPILVDDVPLPSGEATAIFQSSTWDLDTVEVARGPQPTSTGRNAFGGAVRVYTRDPEFFLEGAIRTYFTDQSELGTALMFNTPIVENQLAFRFTGEFSDGNSYIDNNPNPVPAGFDPNDEESIRLRAKLLYEPEAIPGLSFLLSAEHSDIEGPGEGYFTGNINDLRVDPPFAFSASYEDVQQSIYSLRTTYEVSENSQIVARLSSLTNELRFVDTGEELFPGVTFGTTGFDKDITEAEVFYRFQNIGIVKQGAIGFIHTREDETGFNDGAVAFNLTGKIENTALYGEVEFDASGLTPGLSVILGGRYEMDSRERTTFDGTGTLAGTGAFDEEVFLPKFGLRYELSENTRIGYTYSEGFRGGGLDVDLAAPFGGFAFSAVPFSSERIKQHEIFVDTTTANGSLDLAATAFFYTLEDGHVAGAASYPISGDPALGNVPEAQGYGLEIAADYRASDTLSFSGTLGLLETEITRVTATQGALLGLELPRAPNVTASFGINYQNDNGFDAFMNARFVGDHVSSIQQSTLSSYTVVDVGIGYEQSLGNGGTIRYDAFVNNLFDERYQTFEETTLRQAGQPRTLGVSVTARF